MAANTPGQQLNDLLVTRNFDPQALSAKTGRPPLDAQGAPDPEAADMFTFDFTADSGKNYGTVVCFIGPDNNLIVSFGDNLGRGMEFDDKNDWYEFLAQLRNFAKRNRLRYDMQNIRNLKHTMAGIAAIKEGLFEGYYGNRKVSYAGEPTQARLMIKHDRTLGENDARFRYVESLFIETADGERFKLPFRKLAGGRAMLEHVRHGGTPYDARGQHIVEMVEQINVLSQFRRAHQGRVFEGAAGELVAETTQYLDRLRHNLKAVSHDRGYTQYFESWSPTDVSESDLIVEDLKGLFVETRIDPRIEQALPMLARIQKEAEAMREADIFESWANRIVEGTWSLPETPEQQDELKQLMSQPLPVGADGMNATEQLYGLIGDDALFDIIGDIAEENPDANCWDDPRVQNRLEELGVYMVTPAEPAVAAETPPVAEGRPEDLPGIDYDRPGEGPRRPKPSGGTTPRRHNDDPDFMDPDQRRLRAEQERLKKAWAEKHKGVAEGQADQVKKIVKKNGNPVGEIGTDPEASPGNGNWYVKHYASGYDVVGFDNAEEALAELKHCMKQGVAEGLNEFAQGNRGDDDGNDYEYMRGYKDGSGYPKAVKSSKGKEIWMMVTPKNPPLTDLYMQGWNDAKYGQSPGQDLIDLDKLSEQGVAEGEADQVKRVVKQGGKPVGEIGIDPEASPGSGQWYVKHYASGYDVVGFDTPEEALEELKHCMTQGVREALSRKDLLKQIGDKLNDPEFRKQPADPTKRWEKGDLYKGPGPDDYGYTGYQGHGMPRDKPKKKKGVAEGDNLSTFEEAQCNHTEAGEHCPEHGLAECGNYGVYESELARIKSLALLK